MPEGTTVRLAVTDFPKLNLGLRRDRLGWRLVPGDDAGEGNCFVAVAGETLWRAWTTNGSPADLEASATVQGPAPQLAKPLWEARAIISSRPTSD